MSNKTQMPAKKLNVWIVDATTGDCLDLDFFTAEFKNHKTRRMKPIMP